MKIRLTRRDLSDALRVLNGVGHVTFRVFPPAPEELRKPPLFKIHNRLFGFRHD